MSISHPSYQIISKLNAIGVALSSEKNLSKLLEKILLIAKEFTHSDGGSIYLLKERKILEFAIVHNDTLKMHFSSAKKATKSFPDINLDEEEKLPPEKRRLVAQAAINKETIHIENAYEETRFNFSASRQFDQTTGYRSRSFLTVPMLSHEDEVIGVLQLINAQSKISGEIVPFSEIHQKVVESLASQGAVALSNQRLVENLNGVFEGFVRSIANAIDAKSPFTANHCKRVPVITDMFARAVNRHREGPLGDVLFSEDELHELQIAALLHDCGKVTTPVHIIDKETRLQTLFDRIELIRTRFRALKDQVTIVYLQKKIHALKEGDEHRLREIDALQEKEHQLIDEIFEFIQESNLNYTFMSEERQEKIREIAQWRWMGPKGTAEPLLTADEVENLCIMRGTLNEKEREVINDHVLQTIKMLDHLPFPKNLCHVPEIAGSHHEKIDGTGYPFKKKGSEMSLQAKILAIADIFEALTSNDRPYKKPLPVSVALEILSEMASKGHIDPELYDVFIKEKVFLQYGFEFLLSEQIDTLQNKE